MTKTKKDKPFSPKRLEAAYEEYYKTTSFSPEEQFPIVVAPADLPFQELKKSSMKSKLLLKNRGIDWYAPLGGFTGLSTCLGVVIFLPQAITTISTAAVAWSAMSPFGILAFGGIAFGGAIQAASEKYHADASQHHSDAKSIAFAKWAKERYGFILEAEHLNDLAKYGVCDIEGQHYMRQDTISETGEESRVLEFATSEALSGYLAAKKKATLPLGEVPLLSKNQPLEYIDA